MVTATFATELYLKVLHQVHGHAARGHNLLELFDALPDATRERVAQLAVRNAGAFDVQLASMGTFRTTIEGLATAFTDWRYWYETGQALLVQVQPLILAMKALDEACREQGAA